jgi:hypothetical protein
MLLNTIASRLCETSSPDTGTTPRAHREELAAVSVGLDGLVSLLRGPNRMKGYVVLC